jgi:deoxyribose-phosphate aldolase
VAPHPSSRRLDSSIARNPGGDLDLPWVLAAEMDAAEAADALAATARDPTAPPSSERSLLLRAISFLDLTTLSGDDTPARVRDLCARARQPLRPELAERLGAAELHVAAVCVYHHFLPVALDALAGSGIPVAVACAGFPAGLSPLSLRVAEVRAAVEAGADEIDAVINRSHVLTGEWEALYDEVRAFRAACGEAHLKVILGTGDLGSLTNVARASRLCMLAGADFIKTSTGKEAVNATLPVGVAMLRSIREYAARTGCRVGFKPAGGIRTPAQALEWLRLVRAELGEEWLRPELFRIGASTLLGEIERAV